MRSLESVRALGLSSSCWFAVEDGNQHWIWFLQTSAVKTREKEDKRQHNHKGRNLEPDVVAYTFNCSIQELEAVWSLRVQGQPELHSEALLFFFFF